MTTGSAHKYNLLIVHTPRLQDVRDFIVIRSKLLEYAPEVRTIIVSISDGITPEAIRLLNELPTLIFSPAPVELPADIKGNRLVAQPKLKEQEMTLLEAAGFPVPKWTLFRGATSIPEYDLGPVVVVKPNRGRQGKDVKLVRKEDLAAHIAHTLTPQSRGLVIQEWIDTGPCPSSYRVFTVLGHVVYCIRSRALSGIGVEEHELPTSGMLVSSNGQDRAIALAYDDDVIELGRKIHRALPQFPTLGIDIIREEKTGRLYVLELNSFGFTWHLSSNYGRLNQQRHGINYYIQFGALEVIARALADATPRLAGR